MDFCVGIMLKLVDLLSIFCLNHIKYGNDKSGEQAKDETVGMNAEEATADDRAMKRLMGYICNFAQDWLVKPFEDEGSDDEGTCVNRVYETYLIGIVLALITVLLWALLRRERRRHNERENQLHLNDVPIIGASKKLSHHRKSSITSMKTSISGTPSRLASTPGTSYFCEIYLMITSIYKAITNTI